MFGLLVALSFGAPLETDLEITDAFAFQIK